MLRLALPLVAVFFGNCATAATFFETFEDGWVSRWTHSSESKYTGRFKAEPPPGFTISALKVPEKAKRYGLATKFETAINPQDGLALQYELKLADGLTCGGAYLKFITDHVTFEASSLKEDTPYTIMFGPDKCGSTNKVHLIFRHKNPNGDIQEKHLRSPPLVEQDKMTHVYTAVLKPDNTYQILIDGQVKKSGSIFQDFEPEINPPKEIDDPDDEKPKDWVDSAKIPDPEASKPDDWDEDAPRFIEDEDAEKPEGWLIDEPSEIDDPGASKPVDWDEEEDGVWEAPKVKNPACMSAPGCGEWRRPVKPNPAYKGKWAAPLIDNPAYKGPWSARRIPNPDYFEDNEPLKSIGNIGGVALEIWTMDSNYYFSNILATTDLESAEEYREKYWKQKHEIEEEAKEQEDKKKAGAEVSPSSSLAARMIALVEDGPLAFIYPLVEPFLGQLKEKGWLAWPLLAVPLLLLAVPLTLFFGPSKKVKVGKVSEPVVRANEEISGPDDKSEAKGDENGEEDDEDDKGIRRRRRDT